MLPVRVNDRDSSQAADGLNYMPGNKARSEASSFPSPDFMEPYDDAPDHRCRLSG
ncbi:hypothetical protein ACVWZ6_005668 [Bradyrhizobium sp. GM6.1]